MTGEFTHERDRPIRVVIADDQQLVRAGFGVLLDADECVDVVGEAENGDEAVDLARRLTPDVILMDIRMPVRDGIAATTAIVEDDRCRDVRVLVLTTFDADELVYEALRAGASGFLLKDTDPIDLLKAIRVIADGEALLSPSITRRLISQFADQAPRHRVAPETLWPLTDREREVMVEVASGASNHEIAERLYISPTTAKTHVSRVMTKLGARDRAQLVNLAYETGLVIPRAQ